MGTDTTFDDVTGVRVSTPEVVEGASYALNDIGKRLAYEVTEGEIVGVNVNGVDGRWIRCEREEERLGDVGRVKEVGEGFFRGLVDMGMVRDAHLIDFMNACALFFCLVKTISLYLNNTATTTNKKPSKKKKHTKKDNPDNNTNRLLPHPPFNPLQPKRRFLHRFPIPSPLLPLNDIPNRRPGRPR